MTGQFAVEPLGPNHGRAAFTCGIDALDRYFRPQAGQEVRRRVTACFVARDMATGAITGYYTLAAGGIPLAEIPAALARRLPRYPWVPVARLGRLAVASGYRGLKLGAALLWDAVDRTMRSEVAAFALVVDAKDEQAESFYLHHGFMALAGTPGILILPLPKKREE